MLGTLIGMQIVNGRIRPKFGKAAIIKKIILMGVMLAGFLYLFYLGVKGESYYLLLSLIGIASLIYIMVITPEFQNPNNYSIKLKNEDSLEGCQLLRPIEVRSLQLSSGTSDVVVSHLYYFRLVGR